MSTVYHNTVIRVNVTQEDIDRATRENSDMCAVTRAIQRTIPTAKSVSTDIQTIRFSLPEDGERYTYLTPGKIQSYIVDFDAGDDIRPFSFTLTHPAYIQAMQRRGMARPRGTRTVIRRGNGKDSISIVVETTRPVPAHPRKMPRTRRTYGFRAMRINQAS